MTIKIIGKHFKDFVPAPPPARKEGEEVEEVKLPKNIHEYIDGVEKEFGLFELLFDEIKSYLTRVREEVEVQAKKCAEKNTELDYEKVSEECLVDLFPHTDQLTVRLNFISSFASNSSQALSLEQLNTLWDQVITHSLKLTADHQILYNWLRKACDEVYQARSNLVDLEDLIGFFKDKISSDDSNFQNLSIEGYYCIQSFFILMNQRAKKLILLGDDKIGPLNGTQSIKDAEKKYTSYSNTTGAKFSSYSFNQNTNTASTGTDATGGSESAIDPETIEVQVRAEPDQMEGIKGLWRIAIDCANKKVGEYVTSLLLQLHTSVDFGMEGLIPKFEDQFIKSCFEIIRNESQEIDARTQEERDLLLAQYKECGSNITK